MADFVLKINRKLPILNKKNDHISKNKKSENWFSFVFSFVRSMRIFPVYLASFEQLFFKVGGTLGVSP